MKNKIAWITFLLSFAYFVVLSAKSYTWVFASSDSGDWLAASNWWMVPQPCGSPLYILLGQLLNLLPFSLPITMTILLSCLPAAITATLVYILVKYFTKNQGIAVVSAFVLVASAVFLTQSTILEEYALATMFLMLAVWFYVAGRNSVSALMLALGTSVHIFVMFLAVAWVIAEFGRWKAWIRPVTVFCITTAVFYSVIILIYVADTPKLLAGSSLLNYFTVTAGAIVGNISIFETPSRLSLTLGLLITSFGIASVPLFYSIRKPITRVTILFLGIIVLTLWYQITNIDILGWTFITYMSPIIAILVGVGLSRLSISHTKLVGVACVSLLVVNVIFLNASILTNQNPMGTKYYKELQSIPERSIVVCNPGAYSLGLFYAMSEGEDLIPLVYPYLDEWEFEGYRGWMNEKYNLQIDQSWNTIEVLAWLRQNNFTIYYADDVASYSPLRQCLILNETFPLNFVKRVDGLSGLLPEEFIK